MTTATTSNPAPQGTTIGAPENGTASTKPPRKARKPRASKPPAAPKATKPRKPRRSLLSDIAALGPTHLAAYRSLAQGSPQFTRDVVTMLTASYRLSVAALNVTNCEEALEAARDLLDAAREEMKRADATRARLDLVAKSIAHAREDVPAVEDAPTDDDRKGVEIP